MRPLNSVIPNLSMALLAVLASACSPKGEAAYVRPDGETDLSCAALLYAANDLLNDGKATDPDGIIKDKHFTGLMRYATAHAQAKKLEASEVLGLVKIKAFGMMGTISSGSKLSPEKIIKRATACVSTAPPPV